VEWVEDTEGMLRNLSERARHDLHAGMSLVNEALSSLQIWSDVLRRAKSETRGSGAPADREAENLRERLKALLRELEIVANRINDELGDVASATAGMFPLARASVAAKMSFEEHKLRLPPERLASDLETWTDAFDLETGPWTLHLTGTAVPTPQLVVSLRENQVGATSVEPFLTLVRPAERFETVNLDSSGTGDIALPTGESVILLQGDEVWEVRLSFRDR
jgi:hypothetical protein